MRLLSLRRLWVLALTAVLLSVTPVAAAPASPAEPAVAWLVARQQSDGSFPGWDAGASADAIFAFVAADTDPNGVLNNGQSPVSYLGTQTAAYAAKSPAAAGKLLLAVIAAGKNPTDFGGVDLVALVVRQYQAQTGMYGANPTDHAYALLGLVSAGARIPAAALTALERAQLADGGWSYDGQTATGSDTNTTALAVQALVAAGGKNRPSIARAIAYLRTAQNVDGGFAYAIGADYATDANSTAIVIQALAAAGVDPQTFTRNDMNPLAALRALQNPSGAFRYQASAPDDNDLATAQAIPALLQRPLPLRIAPAVSTPSAAPAQLPNTAGSDPAPLWLLIALLALSTGLFVRRRL